MKNIPVPPQESPDQMNDNWQIQNQQLQNLAHNVPGMLYQFRLDANGTPSFPYISSGCREVYGLEPEAVQQNPELILNQCVHSDDLSEVQRTIAESARTLEQWNCRWRIFDTQGQEKWLKGIASPRGCFDGSILWDGCVFDITEQKIIETQLQKSQDFLGLILDNIPQLIFWKDRNSVYQGCNQNFAQVAGVNSPEEIVGKTDFDLAWKQEEAEWFRQCDRKVMDSGEAELHIEEPQQQADGKQAWLDTNKIPLKDSDGNVMGILGTIEDITGRKQAEETLRILNHELEAHVSERTAALEKSLREISDIKSALDQAAMVSITDARGKILFINDKFCEVSQYSPSELIGQNQQIFSYSYTTTPHFKEMWRTIAKGNIWRGEIRNQRKDGSNCWIDTTVAPFMNERGKPYQYIVIGYDVSDRKQSELALLESNHQLQEKTCFLQSIWGGVDYGIYILDVINQGEDFRFVQFNPALIEASPIPVEQLLHKTVRETFPEEIAQIYLNRYRHCVQSSESSFFEEQLPVHGETKWWQLNINPLQNHAGEVQRLIVTSVDISERREAEIALQRLTQNLQEAQRIAHIGNWSYDRGTDTLNWSDEVFRIFGLPLEAETPDIMQWASYFHPTDAELLQQVLNQTYVNQEQSQLELRIGQTEENLRYVHLKTEAVCNQKGKVIGLFGTIMDISERKRAELQLKQQTVTLQETLQELRYTQAQVVQSEKMSSLGQMVAGVAHEINNPVSFIHTNLPYAEEYVDSLLELLDLYQKHYPEPDGEIQAVIEEIELDFLKDDFAQLLKSMQVGTDRIREIVLSLRNFSRLDEAELKSADLHQGIDNTLMILNNRLKAQPDRPAIEIVREYEDMPLVNCYAGQLNQVFMNIFSNAIDALEESLTTKDITPQIRISTKQTDQNSVRISIADNGSGISPDAQEKLFDPFFTTKPVGKGTGLGLSISYQVVVDKHHGTIECKSEPDQGTEFIIQLPIRAQDRA